MFWSVQAVGAGTAAPVLHLFAETHYQGPWEHLRREIGRLGGSVFWQPTPNGMDGAEEHASKRRDCSWLATSGIIEVAFGIQTPG